jgi:CelD/BcsL family acetyltransferase involved in cellulose biosynthesis
VTEATALNAYIVDPLTDPRWPCFVERHPGASPFHTAGWLRALSQTYGYAPVAVTSSEPGCELTNALPLCRISSRFTGRRIVSLPFSDHCQPLANDADEVDALLRFALEKVKVRTDDFLELRPAFPVQSSWFGNEYQSACYSLHWLDLTPPLESIFSRLHKDSIQRKIRRAERERLSYEEGRSPEILGKFYRLLLRTRRRHHLPPQPMRWFRNLLESMGDSVQIRLALKEQLPIAAILTLKHRNSMIYKYGCSDERHHATGSMPFLFWRLIEETKASSIPLLDFGRSDLDNPGLIRFKDQWGTRRTELKYYRVPAPAKNKRGGSSIARRAAEELFAVLPDRLLQMAGNALYRHLG